MKLAFDPKTIRIGEFDVPEPMRVAPAVNTTYWAALIDSSWELTDKWVWSGDHTDLMNLKSGLCHATREAAELHARALIALTETKIINTEGN